MAARRRRKALLTVSKNSRRRRRSRKRQQNALVRARDPQTALARRGAVLQVQPRVERLELAKGYDGFLRGAPEPTLLVAVYGVTGTRARLAGRYVYRFEQPTAYPCKVSTREPSHESCVVVVAEPSDRLVLLVLAIEEDSGRGLQALYAELERADAIVVWPPDTVTPAPLLLGELEPQAMAPDLGHRVHVLLGELDPAAKLEGDDWVDAAVLHAAATTQRKRCRFHLCCANARNDWTAELELIVRRI